MAPGPALLAASSLESQLGFAWESPSPAQVAVISDCFIPQAEWPWAKHRWGPPLACTTLETPGPAHQWTATDHVRAPPPCPCTADPPQGQRVVVCGHNQSLLLTGLSKSLPLTCQQQPRLNYKRRVYSAHMKGAPRVPSLGDRGGCATGPYRTPTTLGHTTKTRSLIEIKKEQFTGKQQ